MPDISMCQNKECKFKKDCYRFTAKPSEFMQAYGVFNCKDKEGADTYFWRMVNQAFNLKQNERQYVVHYDLNSY
jgi:hypothetical protein